MLTLRISEFMMQLKDGAIKNIGGPTKDAAVTLYDVTEAEARAFGDERIKLAFADESGNEVEIALFPDEIETVLEDIEAVRASGTVEGFGEDE